jgi:hypothetical protein
MSLRPLRQVEETNIDFICPFTQERGGCLSYATASGVDFAEYATDPSGNFILGLQINDIEYMNLARQYHRTFFSPAATTDVPCGIVGIAVQGDWITDWVHLVGDVFPGDKAYAGPSGTFTNSSAFGGSEIGYFLSQLDPDPHILTKRGLGFSRQFVDHQTKQIEWENNPADRQLVVSPGYIKIRIDIGREIRNGSST